MPGFHRWYLWWMLFNKTARVLFAALRLSPPIQLMLTLGLYSVIPSGSGQHDDSAGYHRFAALGDNSGTPAAAAVHWALQGRTRRTLPARSSTRVSNPQSLS